MHIQLERIACYYGIEKPQATTADDKKPESNMKELFDHFPVFEASSAPPADLDPLEAAEFMFYGRTAQT